MRNLFFASSAALAAALIVGCASGGSATNGYVPQKSQPLAAGIVPEGQEAAYFPFFKVGSQWTFQSIMTLEVNGHVNQQKQEEVTYQLTKLTDSPDGGQDATFTVLTDDKPTDVEIWRLNKKGLYQVAVGDKTPTPLSTPEILLPFPVKEGQKFTWQGTLTDSKGVKINADLKSVVDGQEQIDTSLGRFNALAVETAGTMKGGNNNLSMATKLWLIPKYGIGRYLVRTGTVIISKDKKTRATVLKTQLMKLKNMTPKT